MLFGGERARVDDNRIEFVEYALKDREKFEADPGEINHSTIAIQQFDLKVFLKFLDLDRKSWLRDVQQLRRARKALEVRDRNECSNLAQVYIHNHTLLLPSEHFNCEMTAIASNCDNQLLRCLIEWVLRNPSWQ